MTKKLEIYKCNICGNIVEVMHEGEGTLVCCGEEMKLMSEQKGDPLSERHMPILEENGMEKTIRVGFEPHPMSDEHRVEFIEVISKDKKWVKRKYLDAGDEPEMKFKCDCKEGIDARELCNIHGLWKNEF